MTSKFEIFQRNKKKEMPCDVCRAVGTNHFRKSRMCKCTPGCRKEQSNSKYDHKKKKKKGQGQKKPLFCKSQQSLLKVATYSSFFLSFCNSTCSRLNLCLWLKPFQKYSSTVTVSSDWGDKKNCC